MKNYKERITLSQNERWVRDIDPFKWCTFWMKHNKHWWCYWVCYAKNLAKFRWYDFDNAVRRYFNWAKHLKNIWKQLETIPFVRLWVNCDPSEDWEHTIDIIEKIKPYQKNIVIITKHRNTLTNEQIERLKWTHINTSISAIDTFQQIDYRLKQYNRLKWKCNSILRVNTFNFINEKFNNLQNELLWNEKVINNIMRIPKNHALVRANIVTVEKINFLNSYCYASINDKNVFFWHCNNCKEQCWVNMLLDFKPVKYELDVVTEPTETTS
jgi:hypothetical protein